MQLLHLIDTHATPVDMMYHAQSPAGEDGARHAWVYAGPEALRDRAVAAGLPRGLRVPEVAWNNPRAWLSLRNALRDVGRCDGVRCLSLRGAGIARFAVGRVPIVTTLHALPETRGWGWLEKQGLGVSQFTVTLPACQTLLQESGVGLERITLEAPRVNPAMLRAESRPLLRARWGIGEDEYVVAVLGDPPGAVDALRGELAVGLAREAGREVVMLVGPRAAGLHRALHVARRFERGPRVIQDACIEEPWHALPACDVAIALKPGLSALWARAAGLPVFGLENEPPGELARKLMGVVPGFKPKPDGSPGPKPLGDRPAARV